MTRQQFVSMLASKYYRQQNEELIKFEDGSVITVELLEKILDALNQGA